MLKQRVSIVNKIKEGLNRPEIIDKVLEVLRENFREDEFAFEHSLRVGLILKKMGSKEETITAGILHQIREKSRKELKNEFPEDVSFLLKKVRQLANLRYPVRKIRILPIRKRQKFSLNPQPENLRKMFFVITKDIRAIFIKLADRLDEMKNLEKLPKGEQKRMALESLEIFAPLAYGIGMGEIKGQLEDLAFPCLYPKEFNWLMERVKEKYTEREKYLERVKETSIKILNNEKIPFVDIHARAKHYFSLYEKLLRHDMNFEEIYDLVALRIIVPDIEDCYKTLGIIHKNWNPLEGRIKDYIASPKPNGYRSLHTTVSCLDNKITEFQIKTPQMYHEAEYGIAAHLAYKEKIPEKIYKDKFSWAEELRSLSEKVKNLENLSEYFDFNLFKDRIFVFTPKGDVIDLPKGSCPIDFAYAIHSEIGDYCREVKVNGKMSKLFRPLKNGDLVEIITSKEETPSRDWLRFVKTKFAKEGIKKCLEKNKKWENLPLKTISAIKRKFSIFKKLIPLPSSGEGGRRRLAFFALRKKLGKPKVQKIYLGKETGFSINLPKCCSPQPGDKIKAFISKEKGASIHKVNCENLKKLQKKWPQKIIDASWGTPKN
jgi:GTP pyrophosphokinase